MNIKNNKRRKESIQRIQKVFIELLQTESIDTITVSDICKKAELNRSTFYANFIDIYDLADKVKEHLEEEFLSLYHEEITYKLRTNNFLKLLCHIRDNQLFYKTYLKLGFDGRNVFGYDEEYAKSFDDEYIEYHIEFFQAGFNAIIKKWLAGGCRETPEQIQQILKLEYSGRKF